ncbi:MAG: SGNH/GDSL hydrolase family protein [Isosphaeraceae bacterium]
MQQRLHAGVLQFLRRPRWLASGVAGRRLIQRSFAFLEHSQRLTRRFKIGIVLGTSVLVFLLLASSPSGRYLASWLVTRSRWALLQSIGIPPTRAEIDADWKRKRRHDIEEAHGKLRETYDAYGPAMRRLLDYAGLDPDHALLRWGNFNRTIYLPSTIFLPDETGRSYRFRPSTRSIWVRNLRLKGGILAYFPIPLGPDLDQVVQGTGAEMVQSSVQTTNSWGLRGPEPDLQAPLRGIILGDSYMQGLLVGDDQTPGECLKRYLAEHEKTRTEILNTGHLGYSPEQEYYTLREYADQFHPTFVVLSLFANDFGDLFEVLHEGKGDWEEGRYWLREITQFCRTRGILCLAVPAPWYDQVEGPRNAEFYPGMVSTILGSSGLTYFDPIEAFADRSLKQYIATKRQGKDTSPNPLFNGHLADGHFSPLGCEVWARAVGHRLSLILERRKIEEECLEGLGGKNSGVGPAAPKMGIVEVRHQDQATGGPPITRCLRTQSPGQTPYPDRSRG